MTLVDQKETSVHKKSVFILFTFLSFSLVDAMMTLFLLQKGAWEANPVMRFALSVGVEFFIVMKYLLTTSGMVVLLKLKDQKIFHGLIPVEAIIAGLILFYEALIIYEIMIYHLMK